MPFPKPIAIGREKFYADLGSVSIYGKKAQILWAERKRYRLDIERPPLQLCFSKNCRELTDIL